MSKRNDDNLIWMDLEMTGLDPESDRIIEIATVITNSDLEVIDEGPVFAIHQPNERLNGMDGWNTEHHGQSGLTRRVQESTTSESQAEAETLAFIQKYVSENKSPLCGNSIHQDRRFLNLYMPKIASFCHYRNLDVSTLKILAQLWAPKIATGITKVSEHIALQDIHDSIEELRYYRKHLFHL
jgi:oligoribonuclease